MPTERSSPSSESSEDARAILQLRVALFWKVMFLITLLSTTLGAFGAIAEPGVDFVVVVVQTFQTGIFWWLCGRGQRSMRFSRWMETGGLLLNLTGGAFLGRYVLIAFAREHAVVTENALGVADGYITMLHVSGIGLMLAVRAAVVPSSPLRTIFVTALVGTPLLASTFVVPTADGGLAWRALDSSAYPWMPATAAMMWGFVIITCSIVSKVIYGLRAEVREARQLGQYVLEKKIGEGGMGEVYRARHGMMRRPTALKLLRQDRANEHSVRRFEREVQLTARLTHPNTITLFDYGRTHDGVFYYAMELLDGASLHRIVARGGAQKASRVRRILSMACGALAEAHAIGLIHRDIKPANIMLCTQGGERDVVKLLDFGLVKELAVDGDVELTGKSTLTGTPQYMAPESIRMPEAVDPRTDLYSLGAVAYYLLAGSEVFTGQSILEVCSQHLHQTPEPLSTRGVAVPPDLEALVLACLEKDPARRPQTALTLKARVEACEGETWNSEDARSWWVEHQPLLDADAAESTGAPRTIAIDGARSPALA